MRSEPGILERVRAWMGEQRMLEDTDALLCALSSLRRYYPKRFELLGVTVGLGFPDMDFTHPALVDPTHIIEPIQNRKCTYSFGSPALWDNVGRYCAEHQIRLPGLKRIFMSGAPVPRRVHDTLLNHVLDADAETYTPYGATESLPIANFS